MSFTWAITILFGLYFVGSIVSYATKGRIGTALFSLLVLLFGFNLKIFPSDMITAANLGGMYALLNLTILINVGSSFDVKKLKNDWRLVVTILLGIVGMGITIMGIGGVLFGQKLALMSFPTLVGGAIATSMMSQAASDKGLLELAAIVVLVNSVQMWVGIPLITYGVRKESSRLLSLFRKTGETVSANRYAAIDAKAMAAKETNPTLFDKFLPKQCHNMFFYMFLACFYGAVASVIASFTSSVTHGVVGAALVGMVLGCVLTQVGLLPKEPLVKAGMIDFLMFILIMTMYGSLASLSIEALLASLLPIAGLVLLGAAGMLAVAIPLGKMLGYSTGMCFAFGMGCYCGYPGNYQIANEIIDVLAKTPEEKKYLKDEILTRVVEGSVVSVSITSVVIAGIFVGLV